ncbi:MAG: stage sporulation protein [Chlamydiales bacterium]|jgi:sigma-B regulation protein RsbU (phosphoserine phosphatase)|nr:stage sporulation protein [Chlamydiales bacterium]
MSATRKKILQLVLLINIALTALFAGYSIPQMEKSAQNMIHNKLLNAAYSVFAMLRPNYFELAYANLNQEGEIATNLEEHTKIDQYIQDTSLAFAYTLVKKDNKLFVASRSLLFDVLSLQKDPKGLEVTTNLTQILQPSFEHQVTQFLNISYHNNKFSTIVLPVYSSNGDCFLIAIGLQTELLTQQILNSTFKRIALLFSLLFVCSFLILAYVTKKIGAPINELNNIIKLLIKNRFRLTPKEQYALSKLEKTYHKEIYLLVQAFQRLAKELQYHLKQLNEVKTTKEKIEDELQVAQHIQMSLLPSVGAAFPSHPRFDLYAILQPAQEVGGDMYDFFLLDKDNLVFMVGDVSGKGAPAAIFMVVAKTLIKARSVPGLTAGEILTRVNNDLCAEIHSDMFVSMFLGVLNAESGSLEYSIAGHNPPYYLAATGRITSLKSHAQPALGLIPEVTYHNLSIQLKAEDKLFLYTNIPNEARSPEGKFYTYEDLENALFKLASLSARQIAKGVMQDVKNFTDDKPQSDDITVFGLHYKGIETKVNKRERIASGK